MSVVVVGTKIARSRLLGICICCNYDELVDIVSPCQIPAAVLSRIKASSSQQTNVWNRIKDLPVSHSAAVTLCDQLVSVSDIATCRHDNGRVDSVYCYDVPVTSTWRTIVLILSCQAIALVTALYLHEDKLIIVLAAMVTLILV